jgi:hypothetical protein
MFEVSLQVRRYTAHGTCGNSPALVGKGFTLEVDSQESRGAAQGT